MFGAGTSGGTGGGFGGFGTNNNNNNQAGNTSGSVFGTGTGFGQPASAGFGNTGGGFGQQQNTSNAFGAATTTNTGFGGTSGGFGATNNAAASPFGAAKPFGGTTQPASGGLFGGNNASNTTSGASGFGFGAANNASNVFGGGGGSGGGGNTAATSGGGLFGGSKPTFGPTTTTAGATGGLFGTANSGTGGAFGGAANTGIGFSSGTGQGPLTGTANPPYTAFTEKEAQGGTTNHFQTIAFMPAYKNWSLEELRLQDYVQGRRYGTDSGNSGAFGQGTQFGAAFGATNNNNTSSFGATNNSATTGGGLFGNTANNNTTSAPFGATNTGGGFGTGGTQTGGGLFGANKPATGGLFGGTNNTATAGGGGGLFGTGANNTATGAFGGGNTTGTFGAAGTTGATGGLFGAANNNQQAQKPFSFGNTGTGFGGGASNTAFNAQGNNAPTTGGGLFGNTQSTTPAFGAAQAGTGFGGAGGAFGAAGQNQGGTAFGTFGNNNQAQQNKPPFGAPFGAAQATTTAGGGGLFGNNNQQQQQQQQNAGGLFGGGDNKPFGPPTISTGAQGGGLFGGGAAATGGTAGGLFGGGQAPQASQGGLFGSGAGANAGGGGLFGNNANKPPGTQGGGLFSNTGAPAPTGGGLFGGPALGSQLNTSTGGGFFNNQQQQQPQQQQQMAGNSLFGSQFGNSLQGQQQQQGLTASIMDSPYVNPVLGSSLGNVPNSLMGPIAIPLSSSVQTKKAAMIPHYKIAPRQPSLAPRLGNSFSRSGSPFAASSGSHATLGNSGSLGRSFSSTNKLHLFDGDDSILNSSSFTPNTSSRVASLKRLVIDKKIRDQDLFSGGQDLRKDNSGSSDFAAKGGTKGILKKTVSFDIAANRRGEDELFGVGTTSAKGKETVGPTPTAEEMGFLRSTPERRRFREVEETSNGSASANDAPVVGNEVAIIPEKPKDDKSPGTYWMVPNASKLKILPKEQQKRVMNLTIGRRGYGQVRFDNPVDISDIEDIDKIPGHIVLFAQRVCTVYPETMPKPPPGKGLNVPATITLEDCFPVSKNERGKIRDPEHPRYITHIRRLKSIKDTEFVNYLANEGMWIFRVRHFTTYGLVESDDEEEEGGDYTVDESTMLPTGETPTPARTPGSSLWDGDEESSMDADVSGVDNTSSYDDTFDFKKFGSSAITSRSNRDRYGSFLDRSDREPTYEQSEEGDVTMDQSFLDEGSVGSAEDVDEPAEPESDQSEEEVDTTIVVDDETDGDVTGASVLANSYMLSPVKEDEEEDTITQDTPAKPLPMGQNWTEQLNNTISPKKRRFGGESFMASTRKLTNSPVKKFNIEPMSYGLLDLANDLYGGGASGINGNSTKGKGKAVWDQVESPTSSRCRHESAWTATKDDKGNADTESDDKRWRNAIKPVWGKDGSIIYFGDLEGLERRRNYRTDLKLAKLKYSIQDSESQGAPEPLQLQLRATAIKRDEFNVPVAELQMDTLFHSFTQLGWSPDDPASQHEKSVWELASVLWDPITRELALEEESQEMIEYMQETCRKERLSKFLEALVEVAADEHVHGATTLEEAAIAHLTAHRIEQACASLLEAGDFRLANLISMVGGDAKLSSSIKKQLEQWKNKGVLAEIPVPIRALYELLAGNTCYSEGVRGPPEDAAPSFFIPDRFNLDWKRGFGLKLWYGCPEEEPIGNAVVDYEADMREYPEAVPAPKPWYHTEVNPAHDGAIDILWGLLKLYADRELNLEEVLAPMNMTTSYIDYRLSWQLRTIFAKKGIRDFSGGKLHRRIDGTDEFIAGSMADQITIDFAGELETLGMWEWAIFVLLHLTDTDSRETAVRNVIGKHIDELESAEGADVGRKLEFLEKTLLIPKNWIYEARALQARSAGRHLLEAEYLLAAQAWNEAHKTVVKKVAPEAVISGDLEILKLTLAKFEDVDLVDKWNLGGQIYLDYIHLQEYVLSGKLYLGPAKNAPGQKGLPKSNSPKDLARRLLIGLKNADRKGFLQNVAVREMAGVVGSWVLKSEDMVSEAPKLLELPLTEDQFLRKTVNLGLAYYKARLQEVR